MYILHESVPHFIYIIMYKSSFVVQHNSLRKSADRRLAMQPLLDLHVGASMQDQLGCYMYMYVGHVYKSSTSLQVHHICYRPQSLIYCWETVVRHTYSIYIHS